MKLVAQLVHADSARRVVLVRAYDGEQLLGSALGEAADAETAEDRARQRLLSRLSPGQLQAAAAAAPDRTSPGDGEKPHWPRTLDVAGDPSEGLVALTGIAPNDQLDRPAPRQAAVAGMPRPEAAPAAVHDQPGDSRRALATAPAAGFAAAAPRAHANGQNPGGPTEALAAPLSLLDAAASGPAVGSAQSHGSAQASDPLQLERADRGERTGESDGSGSGTGTGLAAIDSDGRSVDSPARSAPPWRRVAEAGSPTPLPPRQPLAEPAPDPEDWSGELAALELQLRRLGWQRDQEATYLQRAFGHPHRNRLTNYGDLLAYLHALEGLGTGADPTTATVPLRRSELLSQCDALLSQLGWDAEQGRALLERELQVASRQQLNDQQLLHFNMLLESETLAAGQDQAPVVP